MANPYLIQALYGPKPDVPEPNDVKSSPAPQGLSLVERLYGPPRAVKFEPVDHIHSTRRQMEHVDVETEDPETVTERWAPTGPNVLPLGVKSSENGAVIVTPAPSKQPPAASEKATPWAALKLPPERYLPPPGPFYDQFGLAHVLEIDFSQDKCWTCWSLQSTCSKRGTCTKTCKVCDTSEHPGETCPMLYCTISWFNDRKVKLNVLRTQFRQFRPSQSELTTLQRMHLVLETTDHSAPITPNLANPFVQKFYLNKSASRMLDMRPCNSNSEPTPIIGRGMLMRREQQSSTPVVISLDPRLQGTLAHRATFSISNPTPLSDKSVPYNGVGSVLAGDQHTTSGLEGRLQELEDEVMKLRADNILKDREIRQLKAENEQLRGIGYDTGMKRQRI